MAETQYTVIPPNQGQFTVTSPEDDLSSLIPKYHVAQPEYHVDKPDSVPLPVNQSPESFEQAGPATPQPVTGEHPVDTLETWLMKAMSAPGTFIGRLLNPTPQPGKPITPGGINVSGAEDPFIDPSVSMDPSVAKGIVKAAGGMSSINNMMMAAAPFGSMGTGISRGMSGVFAANTVPQLWQQYGQYDQLKQQGQDKEAETVLGEMLGTFGMGSLALYHAGGFGGKEGKLTIEDEHSLTGILAKQLEQAARNGDHAAVQDVLDAFNESTPEHGKRLLANIAAIADKLEERKNAGTDIRATTPQAEKDITPLKGDDTTGPVSTTSGQIEQPAQTPQFAEENLRDNSRDIGGEGTIRGATEAGPINQGDEGAASQGASQGILDASISRLKALYPQYAHIIGGGEGTAPALESPLMEGAGAALPPVIDTRPVISDAIDDDLHSRGIQPIPPGEDINLASRQFGSIVQTAQALLREGHSLGPIVKDFADIALNTSISITRDTRDELNNWYNNAARFVNDREWKVVVEMLRNPDINSYTLDPKLPEGIKKAYIVTRDILDRDRATKITALRQELINMGFPATRSPNTPQNKLVADEMVPNTWGIQQGYYPGIFPGDYTITRLSGVDESGKEIYEPIDTGWRTTSRRSAQAKMAEYLKDHPNETAKVGRDTYVLPGKDLSARSRLIELTNQLKLAPDQVANGRDVDELMKELYDESAAGAYGPLRIAKRSFGHTLKRGEEPLSGGAADKDSFRDYIAASMRHTAIAPARQNLITIRNKVAELAGISDIQRPSDMPNPIQYDRASQFGNLTARLDSSIEGLEGYPGRSDAFLRKKLDEWGFDPGMLNKAYRPIQSFWAFMKLGLRPDRIFTHGTQYLWASYPLLGERFALEGMDHAYDKNYDWLVQDLALAHSTTSADTSTGMAAYMGQYFGRGSSPLDWGKGFLSASKDMGMWPFTEGIDTSRKATAIGAFRKGLSEGMNADQARDYARDITARATGAYSAFDNPSLFRQLPAPATQFRSFMAKTVQFLWNMNPTEWARFGTAIGILGFTGFPALRSLSGMIQGVTGYNPEEHLKRAFPVASRGIWGAAGVDVPTGVGLGDLSILKENYPLGGLVGPAIGDIGTLSYDALKKVANPESKEAQDALDTTIRNLSPEARRVYDEMYRVASTPDLIDPRTGATVIKNLTPYERSQLVVGLTPLRVAEERDAHEYIRNQLKNAKDVKGYFVDKLAELQVNLTQPNISEADRMEIVRQTSMYFKEAQDNNVDTRGIVRTIIQRAKDMQRERLERDIRHAPKGQRPMAYEEMNRFKGEQ